VLVSEDVTGSDGEWGYKSPIREQERIGGISRGDVSPQQKPRSPYVAGEVGKGFLGNKNSSVIRRIGLHFPKVKIVPVS